MLESLAFDHPDAVALVKALYREQRSTYRAPDRPDDDPAGYAPPSGVFLVARSDDGAVVGCGGYRAHDSAGTVEIRKMYTLPESRGHGVGAAVLAELEARAAQAGVRRIILETGALNTTALALYQRAGFTPIAPYAVGREPEVNRAFEKRLP